MSGDPLRDLGRYIGQALRDWQMPGAAVAIVQGDEVIHAAGYGVCEAEGTEAVDANTLFQIGSATKPFTTAALGVLVDENRLRWDNPIVEHLPGFQLQDPGLTRQVTIRDAASHSSGYVDSMAYGLEIMDSDESMRRMRHRTVFAPYRRSFNYSNAMFNVAGRVIEAASGMSWSDFIRRRLFQPLGMSQSGTTPYEFWNAKHVAPTIFGTAPAGQARAADARHLNIAMPHTLQDGLPRVIPWQSYDSLAAAGNIVSNVSDLACWLRLHLNEGTVGERKVLERGTVRELHSTQNAHYQSQGPFDAGAGSGGMGWFLDRYLGERLISHGGLILGFPAYTGLLPERKIGIAILANAQKATYETYTQGYDPGAFHKSIYLRVFDRLAGRSDTDWSRHFLKKMQAAEEASAAAESKLQASRIPGAGPTLPLTQYVGDYADHSRLQQGLQIRMEEGQLMIAYPGAGAYCAWLDHWHQDVFRLRSVGVRYFSFFVRFVIGESGRVTSLSAIDGDFRPL